MKATGLMLNHLRCYVTCYCILAVAVLSLLAVAGCGRPPLDPALPATPSSSEQTVPTVTIVKPERKTIRRTVSQPGHIQAYEQTPVFSKIAGYVQTLNVDIGDRVSQGQTLAVLWVPEMEVEVAQKQALVSQAEAEVRQAKEAVAMAEADFKSAEAKVQATEATRLRADAQLQRTQLQYERLKKAGRSGVLDQENVEETRLAAEEAKAGMEEVKAQVRSSMADRDASRAKWDKARADLAVAEMRLEVARKNHELAQTLLDYRNVPAPFNGVVTQRNVDTRHFVQPATGPRGEALFVVMRTDIMRIRMEVPEGDADWVSKGTQAHIRIPVLKSYEYTGPVTRTSWSLDRTARTLLAEVDVSDPEGQLRPGMYAYATLTAERPNVLTLPASAVVSEGDVLQGYRSFCFLVENGKAWRTPVQVGVRDNQSVEVLKQQTRAAKEGEPGRWIDFTGQEEVVQNASGLSDGQTVQVNTAKH
jgi:multidrug efflux pump subunit AcrA (membrane-fusion protein)